MATIYRVIQIQLNQFIQGNVHMISKAHVSTITVTNIYHSFYIQNGGKKQLA